MQPVKQQQGQEIDSTKYVYRHTNLDGGGGILPRHRILLEQEFSVA